MGSAKSFRDKIIARQQGRQVQEEKPEQKKVSPRDKPEYVVCAAILYRDHKAPDTVYHQPRNTKDRLVLMGYRHSAIVEMAGKFFGIKSKDNCIQGFLTSKNEFVSRNHAAEIALKAGQIDEEVSWFNSEHLY